MRESGSTGMSEQRQSGGVTLWDLLTLISFVLPVAGASGVAKGSHAGLLGYALVLSIALTIGICCAACMRVALVRVGGYLVRINQSARTESLYSAGMLIAAFIWMVFAFVAAVWLATKILTLIH